MTRPDAECWVDAPLTAEGRMDIGRYLPLVGKIATQYRSDRLELEDLRQEGMLGLLHAARTFDPGRSPLFGAYARQWIRSRIHRFAAANCHAAYRIPERRWNDANRARRRLTAHLDPSEPHLALTPEERKLIASVERATSLNTPITGTGLELGDALPAPVDEDIDQFDVMEHVYLALSSLSDRDREIVKLRFGLVDTVEWTTAEVANHFNLTPRRVQQVITRALSVLRASDTTQRAGLRQLLEAS